MRLLFFLAFLAISGQLFAQSIFKPLPKLQHTSAGRFGLSTGDSSFTGFRPVISAAVYGYTPGQSGGALMTGAGISWEKDTYHAATDKCYTDFSIGFLGYLGGALAPTNPSMVTAFGPNISFFNKLISVGGAYNLNPPTIDDKKKPWMLLIGFSVSLNN